jgi:hypothetical protein
MKIRKPMMFALSGAMLLGMTGMVNADTNTSTDVQKELAELRAKVSQLESKQSDTWLNEKRAEEVKSLVKEVLSDADTRASLLNSGVTAGHDKNFFLASEDGNFLLNISGTLQARYIYNHQRKPGTVSLIDPTGDPTDPDNQQFNKGDENENGFVLSRAKVRFEGHVVDPSWQYKLQLASDRDSSTVFAEVATIGWKATDNLLVRVGRAKAPFLHESMVDDEYQMAVDRSYVDAVFTAGYVEGIFATWDVTDMIRISTTIDDGSRSGNPGGVSAQLPSSGGQDFENDGTDIALSGRIDVKLAGDWKQNDDFSSWSGDDMAIFLGAAVRWDDGETGDTNANTQVFYWTVDGSFKMAGFTVSGAFVGAHVDSDETGLGNADAVPHIDAYGATGQVAYNIADKFEPFARFDWVHVTDHDAGVSESKAITAGMNYYIAKHTAKFTVDAVYGLDPLLAYNGADLEQLGLRPDNKSGQVAVRAQLQLLF